MDQGRHQGRPHRVNQELGINLETTTAGWKRELDRLEGDLARPRLRYSDLNRFRDELLRVRSAVQEVPKASGTLFTCEAFSIG